MTALTRCGFFLLLVVALTALGAAAAVEFTLTNIGTTNVNDVRLSAYSNLESAHTHENDYSVLDSRTGGIVVMGALRKICNWGRGL